MISSLQQRIWRRRKLKYRSTSGTILSPACRTYRSPISASTLTEGSASPAHTAMLVSDFDVNNSNLLSPSPRAAAPAAFDRLRRASACLADSAWLPLARPAKPLQPNAEFQFPANRLRPDRISGWGGCVAGRSALTKEKRPSSDFSSTNDVGYIPIGCREDMPIFLAAFTILAQNIHHRRGWRRSPLVVGGGTARGIEQELDHAGVIAGGGVPAVEGAEGRPAQRQRLVGGVGDVDRGAGVQEQFRQFANCRGRRPSARRSRRWDPSHWPASRRRA